MCGSSNNNTLRSIQNSVDVSPFGFFVFEFKFELVSRKLSEGASQRTSLTHIFKEKKKIHTHSKKSSFKILE